MSIQNFDERRLPRMTMRGLDKGMFLKYNRNLATLKKLFHAKRVFENSSELLLELDKIVPGSQVKILALLKPKMDKVKSLLVWKNADDATRQKLTKDALDEAINQEYISLVRQFTPESKTANLSIEQINKLNKEENYKNATIRRNDNFSLAARKKAKDIFDEDDDDDDLSTILKSQSVLKDELENKPVEKNASISNLVTMWDQKLDAINESETTASGGKKRKYTKKSPKSKKRKSKKVKKITKKKSNKKRTYKKRSSKKI